jgi:hypothetical protein
MSSSPSEQQRGDEQHHRRAALVSRLAGATRGCATASSGCKATFFDRVRARAHLGPWARPCLVASSLARIVALTCCEASSEAAVSLRKSARRGKGRRSEGDLNVLAGGGERGGDGRR